MAGLFGSLVAFGALSFALQPRPPQRLHRVRRACASEGNPWRRDPRRELSRALERVNAELSALQAAADSQEEAGSSQWDASQWRQAKAAVLLTGSALDRLRPYCVPLEYLDVPPLRGAEDALRALLGDDARLVFNFLSGFERLSGAGQKFWEAELYIRRVHDEAGEATVEESARDAMKTVGRESEEFQAALRGSKLLARQNFISAARFGYFLCRGRQRLSMERGLDGVEAEPEEMDGLAGFLAQLQKVSRERNPTGPPAPQPSNLEKYLADLEPAQAVELARLATHEAARALDLRAEGLFGEEQILLDALDSGSSGIEQLQLSTEGVLRLRLEAAAFGAALFEAEVAAADVYELSYTAYGSRAEGPSGRLR